MNFPEPHWKAEELPVDRSEGGQEMPGLALQLMAAGSHPTGLERQGLVPTAPDCGQYRNPVLVSCWTVSEGWT